MILTCYILMKNNTIIKKKVTNPSHAFSVSYKVDNEKQEFNYNFERGKMFSYKKLLGRCNVCFYEHSNPKPLDPNFKTNEITISEINKLGKSTLINQLVDSAKNKAQMFSIWLVLGLAGITGLVLIVVFG